MRSSVVFATFFLLLGTSAMAPAAIDREQSQEFFEDAVDYFRAESYTQAIIQLRNALQQDPNNLPARIMLGETLLRENQPEAAIKELEKAQSMGGDENLILVPLANAYLEIGKFEHVVQSGRSFARSAGRVVDDAGRILRPAGQPEIRRGGIYECLDRNAG